MGRTKQTARKTTGGKAPRMQLSSNSSASFRSYMRRQQSSGSNDQQTKIFVNHDNVFGGFKFVRPKANDMFLPRISVARCRSAAIASDDAAAAAASTVNEFAMRLDFASSLDGNLNEVVLHDSVKNDATPQALSFSDYFNQQLQGQQDTKPVQQQSRKRHCSSERSTASSTDSGDSNGTEMHSGHVTRPPIDIVFVLDISGSMGSTFPDDRYVSLSALACHSSLFIHMCVCD